MATRQVDSRFYTAIAQSTSEAPPLNSSALRAGKDLALGKASSLLGYQSYLTQCRAWKAKQTTVPASFEREVQVHARQALADGRDLATAALTVVRQFRQSGQLDHVLASWRAGVLASGPVKLEDLWADVASDQGVRQGLRSQGLTDDLFEALEGQVRRLQGRVFAEGGQMVMEAGLSGQPLRRLTITPSATGSARSLDDLLRRGMFERVLAQMQERGLLSLAVSGSQGKTEAAELSASASVLAVQLLAQHVRKLEDTGLAVYEGNDPVTQVLAVVIGSMVLTTIGLVLTAAFCHGGASGHEFDTSFGCIAGVVLVVLAAALAIGGLTYIGGKEGFGFGFLLAFFPLAVLRDVFGLKNVNIG